MTSNTVAEMEVAIGDSIRALRLQQNLDQKTLAARAGISVGALKAIESGSGSRLRTLVAVMRVLGREDWFSTIAPIATIDPLTMPRAAHQRQRARRKTPLGLLP